MDDTVQTGPAKAEPSIETERAKYAEVWKSLAYRKACHGRHGLDLWRNHRDMFPPNPSSVLDIGCGTGRLFAHLRDNGINAKAIDLVDGMDPEIRARYGAHFTATAIQDLRELGRRFELGMCIDVMEHLPETAIDAALQVIDAVTDTAVFLIANHVSQHMGADLHLTQRPPEWWQARLQTVFAHVERLPYVRQRWNDPDVVFLFRCN